MKINILHPIKTKTAVFLTREYMKKLSKWRSHETHQKGLSRAMARVLDHARPEFNVNNESFNEAAYLEYIQLLKKYNIPLPPE
jgi:hypothetical protein